MRNFIKIQGITQANYDQPGYFYTNVLKEPEVNLLIRNPSYNGTQATLQYTFDGIDWYFAHSIGGTVGQKSETNYGDLQGIWGARIIPGHANDVIQMDIMEYYVNVVVFKYGP